MIVASGHAAVIMRLGRYLRTQGEGRTVLRPIADRVVAVVDLHEQQVPIIRQSFGTADGRAVTIDAAVRLQVFDAKAAALEVADYRRAVKQLTCTALRTIAAQLTVEQARASFGAITSQVRGVLAEVCGPWGIRIVGVQITAIEPVGHDGRYYPSEGKL